ncbi:uncharacterized protein LOC129589530 [Paramacrobiotus metropolitanus]|uniref:uncharacterized protein LOC129589530 n=1 Tax=Paramacrobiotus metropolitanus TaxID=2943436 RepID=UPI002446398F|nr:uncharacterized protein LOC129589530 [Paramacrobiotus metropolitanus]
MDPVRPPVRTNRGFCINAARSIGCWMIRRRSVALISLGPDQPAVWLPARGLQLHMYRRSSNRSWWLRCIQVSVDGVGNAEYLIGEDARSYVQQRFCYRGFGRRGGNVTQDTFRKTVVQLESRVAETLQKCLSCPNFHVDWLEDTRTLLTTIADDCMELLSRGPLKRRAQQRIERLTGADAFERLFWVKRIILSRLVPQHNQFHQKLYCISTILITQIQRRRTAGAFPSTYWQTSYRISTSTTVRCCKEFLKTGKRSCIPQAFIVTQLYRIVLIDVTLKTPTT